MTYIGIQPYVVGWGTLALINTAIAGLQGRSRLLWFLISLVLGPIATIILVMISKKA
jgi:uncharacterized membrane protein YhdT